MEMKDVLDKVFNETAVDLPSMGKTVKLKKVSVRSLQPILTLIADIVSDLRIGEVTLQEAGSVLADQLEADPAKVLKLISKHYDSVIDVLVHLVELDRVELLDLALDDGVLVAQGALLLNRDFFTTRVAPALKLMAADRLRASVQSERQPSDAEEQAS